MAVLNFPIPTQLKNVLSPTDSADAATKAYVDAALTGGSAIASAGGSNTQVQYNANGALGANSNFTFNSATSVLTVTGNIIASNANLGNAVTSNYFIGSGSLLTGVSASSAATVTSNAQPNITSVGALANLSVTGTTNLGNIANITITGGSNGQVITTNGSGVLSFTTPATPTLSATVDEFTGDGSNTSFTLSSTPINKNFTFVVLQGIMQPKSSYSVTGTTLTFSAAPPNTALIEVTTMGMS